jgi:formate-dependent nitrite reductase membrane component NrfD
MYPVTSSAYFGVVVSIPTSFPAWYNIELPRAVLLVQMGTDVYTF